MKKLLLVAICAMAVMFSCKQNSQTAPANSNGSLSEALDSIIEENDTTPLPMFIIGGDGKYMHMLYWADIEEPQHSEGDEDYFDNWHKSWELQEMFRRNAAQYTNLITCNGIVKVKFVDEVLKNPDGGRPSIGQIHGREDIPSLCARYEYVNPDDKNPECATWGLVLVTDSYLKSRKRLEIKSCLEESDTVPRLPADIVKKLEKEYGMEAVKSEKLSLIDNRYIHGTVEFKGEYKNAPKDQYDEDRKFSLALELLIDGDKIYKLEQLGAYDENWGTAWNADADGYISNTIEAAFEGPKGLELCYTHGAPESYCIGMLFPRDNKLIELEYEIFQTLIDEEIPVWKKDLAEMDKLYHADEMGNDDVQLTQWGHCFIDYDNDWIWMRDKDGQNGAFFIRNADKYELIAIENPKLRPSCCEKDGVHYLKLAGPAGGPSWQQEIHAFKDGKRIWKLNVLQVEGEIDGGELNGKDISKEEAKAYLDKVPEGKEIYAGFRDINEE